MEIKDYLKEPNGTVFIYTFNDGESDVNVKISDEEFIVVRGYDYGLPEFWGGPSQEGMIFPIENNIHHMEKAPKYLQVFLE